MPFLGFSPWSQKFVTMPGLNVMGGQLVLPFTWFREIASGRPGLITKIGIDTFLDPRRDGGVLNEKGGKNMFCRISVIDIGGEEYLLYQSSKTRLCSDKGYYCR